MWNSDKCECCAECEYECVCDWAVTPNEWHSLTDDEINTILMPIASYDVFDLPNEAIKLARAIEQALKEKNFD